MSYKTVISFNQRKSTSLNYTANLFTEFDKLKAIEVRASKAQRLWINVQGRIIIFLGGGGGVEKLGNFLGHDIFFSPASKFKYKINNSRNNLLDLFRMALLAKNKATKND